MMIGGGFLHRFLAWCWIYWVLSRLGEIGVD
jgi:hypothetical protein